MSSSGYVRAQTEPTILSVRSGVYLQWRICIEQFWHINAGNVV